MEKYKNLNGNSGITHYKIGDDNIVVKFKGKPQIYVYYNSLCGKRHIDKMKMLAIKGLGLSTYISQHPDVKYNFERKKD